MGADIHMYVEYSSKELSPYEKMAGQKWWSPFGGRINPGRNYSLFGLIAGVRDTRHDPVIEPRGLPDDLGYYANDDAHLTVSDEFAESEGYTSKSNAERWVASGCSDLIVNPDGGFDRVTHPDWHSHTWLTPQELFMVLGRYADIYKNDPYGDPGVEYRALLAAMRALEDDGKNDVRVVIWFDN